MRSIGASLVNRHVGDVGLDRLTVGDRKAERLRRFA
jgi:hypothetical protein